MLLSIFMLFIHLHHICRINRETGVSQWSMSQSRQGTPSVTATCLVILPDLVSYSFPLSFFLYPAGAAAGSCFLLVSYTSVANGCVLFSYVLLSLTCPPQRGRFLYCIEFFFFSFFFSFFFFFFFLSTCQYLIHATFDFDQTWPKWPVPWPLLAH